MNAPTANRRRLALNCPYSEWGRINKPGLREEAGAKPVKVGSGMFELAAVVAIMLLSCLPLSEYQRLQDRVRIQRQT